MSFDLPTGQSTILKKTNGEIEGQPIAKNGLIYLSAGGIITVFKTIQSLEWVQWNKDTNHFFLCKKNKYLKSSNLCDHKCVNCNSFHNKILLSIKKK